MRRSFLILLALLPGCAGDKGRAQHTPLATPAQSFLKPIELHYGIYLARHDHRISVSPDGMLRSIRTDNKSYGPNDIDPSNERTEIRQGRLLRAQMNDLALGFADWDSLSSEPYSAVPDDYYLSIRYGEKTVSGGSGVPQQVTDVRLRLMELARSMPVVEE